MKVSLISGGEHGEHSGIGLVAISGKQDSFFFETESFDTGELSLVSCIWVHYSASCISGHLTPWASPLPCAHCAHLLHPPPSLPPSPPALPRQSALCCPHHWVHATKLVLTRASNIQWPTLVPVFHWPPSGSDVQLGYPSFEWVPNSTS